MSNRDDYYKCHGTPNCECVVCGKKMYVRPNRLKRTKHGITCSLECSSKNRSGWFKGENNHQYGLKGELNASFKSYKRINNAGYVTVYTPEHPFHNYQGRVLEHRLVVEQHSDMYDDKYFVVINGKKYLMPCYDVHHINEIVTDNRPENLRIVTTAEHRKIHNENKVLVHNRKGRIIAFLEKGVPIPIGIKLYGDGITPVRKTTGSSCFDCYAHLLKPVVIKPGTREKIPLGFGLELPLCYEAIIRPRSGLSLQGIDEIVGTIDEDFKSEISAILVNNSGNDFTVNNGDRVCQLAIRRYEKFSFVIVDELSKTDRGENGFGSTGV